MQETKVGSLVGEDHLGGNGNPLQYSCLENPMDRGAWWATVHEVTKSQTPLSMHTPTMMYVITYLFTCLNRHLFICLYLYICRYTSAYRCICIYTPSVHLLRELSVQMFCPFLIGSLVCILLNYHRPLYILSFTYVFSLLLIWQLENLKFHT